MQNCLRWSCNVSASLQQTNLTVSTPLISTSLISKLLCCEDVNPSVYVTSCKENLNRQPEKYSFDTFIDWLTACKVPWTNLFPIPLQHHSNHIGYPFWYAAPHLWNKLPPTLRVPYQFNPSSSPSSFPLSYSDPGPLVDLSCGVFHYCLKTSHYPTIYLLLRLISWNLTTWCLAVTGGGSVGESGRSSHPSWLLGAL